MVAGGWAQEIIFDFLTVALNEPTLAHWLVPDINDSIYHMFQTPIISDEELK